MAPGGLLAGPKRTEPFGHVLEVDVQGKDLFVELHGLVGVAQVLLGQAHEVVDPDQLFLDPGSCLDVSFFHHAITGGVEYV